MQFFATFSYELVIASLLRLSHVFHTRVNRIKKYSVTHQNVSRTLQDELW